MIGQTHHNAFSEHPGHRVLGPFACLLVDDVESIFQRLAHGLGLIGCNNEIGYASYKGV